MRKNKMMRAASVLLVAVLLTTCVISGTFAKYVTGETFTLNSGDDDANTSKVQVAAWDVIIDGDISYEPDTAASFDLFKHIYDAKDVTDWSDPFPGKDEQDVNPDRIAPGTWGTTEDNGDDDVASAFHVNVTITNNSDVRVRYYATLALHYETVYGTEGFINLPVEFSVSTDGGKTWGPWSKELITSVGSNGDDNKTFSGELDAKGEGKNNTVTITDASLGIEGSAGLQVRWRWLFAPLDSMSPDDIAEWDAIDTAIGKAAAEGGLSVATGMTFDVVLAVTVEQID